MRLTTTLVVVCLLMGAPAAAQVETGSITGRVVGDPGAVLGGVWNADDPVARAGEYLAALAAARAERE